VSAFPAAYREISQILCKKIAHGADSQVHFPLMVNDVVVRAHVTGNPSSKNGEDGW
jgi:hypothetical protein